MLGRDSFLGKEGDVLERKQYEGWLGIKGSICPEVTDNPIPLTGLPQPVSPHQIVNLPYYVPGIYEPLIYTTCKHVFTLR